MPNWRSLAFNGGQDFVLVIWTNVCVCTALKTVAKREVLNGTPFLINIYIVTTKIHVMSRTLTWYVLTLAHARGLAKKNISQ